MSWTIDEILAATGGAIAQAGKKRAFGEIITDSAMAKRGSIFVALKGERLDGHRFVADAFKRGAACAIVHQEIAGMVPSGVTTVRVENTLKALGDLAHYRRKKLAPKVFAITGSNGKTTTKEMVAAILEEAILNGQKLRGKILKTQGNFNNLVGLPLTLLGLRPSHKVAVVELGTNRPGEIQRLAEIAAPDFGIITAVAAAHLEGLTSLAGVAREKGALFRNLRPGGAIAVNMDDPRVRRLGAAFKGRKIGYGQGGTVRAEAVQTLGPQGARFALRFGKRRCRITLRYLGQHNVTNAVGAAALALLAGVSVAAVRRGLQKSQPFAMRMQAHTWRGAAVINDAYNANPASMAAAVNTLAALNGGGEKIAVLGDMFELGKATSREHQELGKRVAKMRIHRLYLLGRQAAAVKTGALSGGMNGDRVIIGKDHRDIARQLRSHIKKGDSLLIKGSRGMRMEKVLSELKARPLKSGVLE
ncbi:MAG TPA: UDP-N-acetylmuramoyl-tripeptide--D-alanyl-D-alanine ligase [Candidatus Binatia bacterium]|nr:UDP-N-acetylmuramoyl-tripeptide--D-alanyl-D-alanine ligase [Candidatus Binatia bacterium]